MKNNYAKTYKTLKSLSFQRVTSDQVTPFDLAVRLVDGIPSRLHNTPALIPGCGFGAFALALLHRGWDPSNITCVELDSAFALIAKTYLGRYGVEVIHTDYLSWQTDMPFDVILANPPYQRPKHAEGNKDNRPLWLDFLSKSGSLLNEGGWMSMLVPGQVVKSTRWDEPGKGLKAVEWGNVLSITTGLESYFNVGTSISNVVVTTGEQEETIVDGITVDLTKRPWLPKQVSEEALSVIDKLHAQPNSFTFKLGAHRADPVNSFGFWRLNQNYSFNPTLTSERDRTKKMYWVGCDTKSVAEAEALMTLMRSKLFTAFRQLTFYEPNYAHLLLSGLTYPDVIPTTDEEIYSAYGLTQAEIDLVESLQKP